MRKTSGRLAAEVSLERERGKIVADFLNSRCRFADVEGFLDGSERAIDTIGLDVANN